LQLDLIHHGIDILIKVTTDQIDRIRLDTTQPYPRRRVLLQKHSFRVRWLSSYVLRMPSIEKIQM
jgi:hypothetical protein